MPYSPTFTNVLSSAVSAADNALKSKLNPSPLQMPKTNTSTAISAQPKPAAWVPPKMTNQYDSSNKVQSSAGSIVGLTPSQKAANDQMTASGKYTFGSGSASAAPANNAVTPPANSQTAAPASTQQSSAYPDIVKREANQDNTQYNQQASGAIGNLNATAAGNQQYADRAKQIADAAGQQISDIGQKGARAAAGYLSTGTSPVGEGNAAILNQSTAAQQQAAAQGAEAQLAGNSQGLTAQNQQASAYNSAAGNALTGQSTAQNALANAASGAAPHFNGYVAIDPQTGSPVNAGGANQAAFAGGQTGAAELLGGAYQQTLANITGAENQANSLAQLINQGNLNPSSINLKNEGIQAIQKNLSSSDYQTLLNTLGTIGKALGVDLVAANNQQGGSLINTINNAITAAKAQNEGNRTTGQSGSKSSGASNVTFDSKGNPTAMSF